MDFSFSSCSCWRSQYSHSFNVMTQKKRYHVIIIAAKSEEFFPSFLFNASIMVLKPISHTTMLIAMKVAFQDPLQDINKIFKITPNHKLPAVIHTIPTVSFFLKVLSS